MVKMLLEVWAKHENHRDDWYFSRFFYNAPAKPSVGESVDITNSACYEVVEQVVHNLKEGYVEVTCSCSLPEAAYYLIEYDDWIISLPDNFRKDEALIRETIEQDYEDAKPVFTFEKESD